MLTAEWDYEKEKKVIYAEGVAEGEAKVILDAYRAGHTAEEIANFHRYTLDKVLTVIRQAEEDTLVILEYLRDIAHLHTDIQSFVTAYGDAPLTPETLNLLEDLFRPLVEEVPELQPVLESLK